MRQRTVLGVLALAGALVLGVGVAAASDHSGTVVAVDHERGTLVVGEVGPWQVKDGEIVITKRTIVVGPTTEFTTSRRAKEPGPTGWPGGFIEVPLDRRAVKAGDFVTVRVEKDGGRPLATKVTVAVTEGG